MEAAKSVRGYPPTEEQARDLVAAGRDPAKYLIQKEYARCYLAWDTARALWEVIDKPR